MENKFIFKLYIAGIAPDNQTMIVAFKKKLTEALGENMFRLEVIDLIENPHLAEEEQILATPTVIRSLPHPVKKVILNLNNQLDSMVGLDIIIKDD